MPNGRTWNVRPDESAAGDDAGGEGRPGRVLPLAPSDKLVVTISEARCTQT